MNLTYAQWLAALCLWREARGCSVAAMTAVWHVILNRTTDSRYRWARTVSGVILQHAQFSSFLQSDPNVTRFPIEPTPGQAPSADWTAWLNCCMVVTQPVGDDPTNGANMYESEKNAASVPWVPDSTFKMAVDGIRFYSLN